MPAGMPMDGSPTAAEPMDDMPGMNMPQKNTQSAEKDNADAMSMMPMHAMYGPYGMSREASGTSWQPDRTPIDAIEFMASDWMMMVHGFIDGIADEQGGPRGKNMAFSTSMLMLMAEHPLGPGTFGIRSMFSLDPLMGPAGYPLLFATGESANGQTPLVDRQHPHNFFMELAGTYSVSTGASSSVFGYLGLPGEPALGPPAFMHRFSGEDIPEAPISHHWLDSTHITEGVASAGAVLGTFKVEVSSFNGREPDPYRWDIEPRAFDSQSARISYNPSEAWSLQISQGFLKQPEQLEPDVNVERRTASVMYQTELSGNPWGTTLAWGQNRRSSGTDTAALLLESTLRLHQYTWFGRAEHLGDDELFTAPSPNTGEVFKVGKLTLGGIDDLYRTHHLVFGVGALVSRYAHTAALDPIYGNPTSAMVFLRAKIEE